MSEAAKHLASTWRGPRSDCVCGHTGDGSDSEHDPTLPGMNDGHGACRVKGCECQHFTWSGWNERFEKALEEVK